jgi:hypothetical protein
MSIDIVSCIRRGTLSLIKIHGSYCGKFDQVIGSRERNNAIGSVLGRI